VTFKLLRSNAPYLFPLKPTYWTSFVDLDANATPHPSLQNLNQGAEIACRPGAAVVDQVVVVVCHSSGPDKRSLFPARCLGARSGCATEQTHDRAATEGRLQQPGGQTYSLLGGIQRIG
jgi:hypothetical protein